MADIKKSFREGVVVVLSCQANVSDNTENQLTYNWRKDGEVFATDTGAAGASLITTTESGTYDVLVTHSEGDAVVTNSIEVVFIPGRNLLRVIELPLGSVRPNKRTEQFFKKSSKKRPTWVKSETIDLATEGQIFALPDNAIRYDVNLEDTFYEVGPPTAGMVFFYAKENDIVVEVTLEGSPGEKSDKGQLGGAGGSGTIKYTLRRGVVHSVKMGYPGRGAQGGPNLNSGGGGNGGPTAGSGGGGTMFYRGGRVIAVSGGGGGGGTLGRGGDGGGLGSSGGAGRGKGAGAGGKKPKALHPVFPHKEYTKKGSKSKYTAIGNATGPKGGELLKGSVINKKIDFSRYSEYEGANNGGRANTDKKKSKLKRDGGGGGTGSIGGNAGTTGQGSGGGGGAGWYDSSSASLVLTSSGGGTSTYGRTKIRFVEFSSSTADSICIAVADESLRSNISGDGIAFQRWEEFRKCWPNRTFHLFQPKGSRRKKSDMFIPENFEDDDKAFYHEVNRDGGKSSNATDWFEIANVQCLDNSTTLLLSIDTSGSMRRSTVAASIDLFFKKCAAAGIFNVELKMIREDWISPFIDYPFPCKKKNDDVGDDEGKSVVEPRGQVVFEGKSNGSLVTQWKVPTGVRQISAVCVGGGGDGESDGGWAGSGGGLSYGTMKVTPGEILRITAGGSAQNSMIERRKDKKFTTSSILLLGGGGESGPGSQPKDGPKLGISGGVERDGGGKGGKGGNKRGNNDGGGGGGAAGYSGNGGMGEGTEYDAITGVVGRQEGGAGGAGGGGGVLQTIGRGGGGVGLLGEGKSGAGQTKGNNDSQDNQYENDGQGGSGGEDGTTSGGGKYGGGGPVSNKDFKGSKFKKGGVGAVRIVWGLDGKTSKYRVYPDRGTEDQTSVEG